MKVHKKTPSKYSNISGVVFSGNRNVSDISNLCIKVASVVENLKQLLKSEQQRS